MSLEGDEYGLMKVDYIIVQCETIERLFLEGALRVETVRRGYNVCEAYDYLMRQACTSEIHFEVQRVLLENYEAVNHAIEEVKMRLEFEALREALFDGQGEDEAEREDESELPEAHEVEPPPGPQQESSSSAAAASMQTD